MICNKLPISTAEKAEHHYRDNTALGLWLCFFLKKLLKLYESWRQLYKSGWCGCRVEGCVVVSTGWDGRGCSEESEWLWRGGRRPPDCRQSCRHSEEETHGHTNWVQTSSTTTSLTSRSSSSWSLVEGEGAVSSCEWCSPPRVCLGVLGRGGKRGDWDHVPVLQYWFSKCSNNIIKTHGLQSLHHHHHPLRQHRCEELNLWE